MINFLAGIGIGLVIGVIGGFALKGRLPSAVWMAPVLAVAGTLIASVLALIFGEPSYGWKEPVLQVVLALGGVGVVAFLASRNTSPTTAAAGE